MGMIDYVLRNTRRRLIEGEKVPWIENSKRGKYIRQVILSAPPWVDRKALRLLQAQARWETIMTGVLHVLDHDVPLNHPEVCGLTVPWNLKVVHWRVNASKGNNWNPHQLSLFGPEDSPGRSKRKATPRCSRA